MAKKRGLSLNAIEQLGRDEILITDQTYKQAFSAYLGGDQPSFITSDSLLNAFHVLLEETVLHLENTNASRLEEYLKQLLNDVDSCEPDFISDKRLMEAASTRLKLTLGISIRLLDPSFRIGNHELDLIIAEETQRIENAEGLTVPPPAWLGPKSTDFIGIEYNRFKPRGFYTRTTKLSRYFRALSWIHAIPFRMNEDSEFLAMLILQDGRWERESTHNPKLVNFAWFVGKPDNPDVETGALASSGIDYKNHGFSRERKEAMEQLDWGSATTNNRSWRIISAARIPDNALLKGSMKHRRGKQPLPSGLDIAAALGSSKAIDILTAQNLSEIAQFAKQNEGLFPKRTYAPTTSGTRIGCTLPALYYKALQLLLDEPPADAPLFMHGDAWQTKSLNTTLSSWAQMRHTMVLQAKQCITWCCMINMPPGFVEPDPQFFEQMNGLSLAVSEQLARTGTLEADYSQLVDDLKKFTTFARPFETKDDMERAFHELPAEKQGALLQGYSLQYQAPADVFTDQIQWLSTLADDIEAGQFDKYPEIYTYFNNTGNQLVKKWKDMAYISSRLESIAHKQLRNVPLTENDTLLIQSYGETLASLMLYEGNSYMQPRDDAPRITDAFSNTDKGKHLQVGMGRARKLMVLYPWNGKKVLCEGAVLPYYEFSSPTRMNDAEWKQKLDSRQRPEIPNWLAPITENGTLNSPTL